jgi:hypothetical protein
MNRSNGQYRDRELAYGAMRKKLIINYQSINQSINQKQPSPKVKTTTRRADLGIAWRRGLVTFDMGHSQLLLPYFLERGDNV